MTRSRRDVPQESQSIHRSPSSADTRAKPEKGPRGRWQGVFAPRQVQSATSASRLSDSPPARVIRDARRQRLRFHGSGYQWSDETQTSEVSSDQWDEPIGFLDNISFVLYMQVVGRFFGRLIDACLARRAPPPSSTAVD